MSSAVVETRNLALGYGRGETCRRLASGLNLGLQAGEMVCLVGENGIGKSTLLRTMAGLLAPLDGNVLLHGREFHLWTARERACHLAVVLPGRVSGERLTVTELVSLGRHPHTDWLGRMRAGDQQVVLDALEKVGVAELAHRQVGTLSDGERQKAMIARALAQEAQILLLDEPLAHLDMLRRVEIMGILRDQARAEKRAVLLSIHDVSLALDFADRLWLMEEGGRFSEGIPEELVLSGDLVRAFSHGEQVFDPLKRGYPMRMSHGCSVTLSGEGEALYWTRQALSRRGFAVLTAKEEAVPAAIRVLSRKGRPCWELTFGDGPVRTFDRLGDLLTVLEEVIPVDL